MPARSKTVVATSLERELIDAIDEVAYERDCTRASALRRLIEMAIVFDRAAGQALVSDGVTVAFDGKIYSFTVQYA